MGYKFPWTNYHELNLDWILNTVKELFVKTEQNNAIVEQYDGRLTEVELTADNAQTAAEQAQQNSTAALDLAQGAQTTATQAQQAAGQAQQAAGQAQTAAGQALEAAATAQQTATQAQQTAQNFDGRITQAENNAENALQAAQAFDEQVQGAITASNNANTAATNAVTVSAKARQIAADANQKSDRTAAQLNAQINTITQTINSQLDAATAAIQNKGDEVLESIPEDYLALVDEVSLKNPINAFEFMFKKFYMKHDYDTINGRNFIINDNVVTMIRTLSSGSTFGEVSIIGNPYIESGTFNFKNAIKALYEANSFIIPDFNLNDFVKVYLDYYIDVSDIANYDASFNYFIGRIGTYNADTDTATGYNLSLYGTLSSRDVTEVIRNAISNGNLIMCCQRRSGMAVNDSIKLCYNFRIVLPDTTALGLSLSN